MKLRSVLLCGWLGIAPCLLMPAHATVIEFDLIDATGGSFVYDYTVTNDTLSEPIEEFTIFFDRSLFENLLLVSAPSGWALSEVFQPDPALPDDGFFDALADPGFGIAPGATLGGFRVQFDFLGGGVPGPQPFDIVRVDTAPIELIDSGTTRARSPVVPVNEPGTIALLAAALLAAACLGARRGKRRWSRALALIALAPAAAVNADPAVVGYELVSTTRYSRTHFDYSYRVRINNTGSPLHNLRAQVTSTAAATEVIDGSLEFGSIDQDAQALSQDTLVIRHDRRVPFDAAVLVYSFSADSARTVGPAGGRLEFENGIVLDIPPGAVAETVEIAVSDVACDSVDALLARTQLTTHRKRCLRAFSGEPDGLVFAEPVSVRLPVSELQPGEIPFWITADEELQDYSLAPTDVTYLAGENVIEAHIVHFSIGGAVAGSSNADEDEEQRHICSRDDAPECCQQKIDVRISEAETFNSDCGCQMLASGVEVSFPSCTDVPDFRTTEVESAGQCPVLQPQLTVTTSPIWQCQSTQIEARLIGNSPAGDTCNLPLPVNWTTATDGIVTIENTGEPHTARLRGAGGGTAMVKATSLLGPQFSIETQVAVESLSGTWRVESQGNEQCSGGFDQDFSEVEDVVIPALSCGSVSAGGPGEPPFTGTLTESNDPSFPLRFSVSRSSSDTPECRAFMQSGGVGITPLSCHEEETIEGRIRDVQSRTATARSEWTFELRWRTENPPEVHTQRCEGHSDATASKQ